MVELPRGEVNETRRGGAGVLELLLVDMQKRSESGYIRCEAGALGGAVGQITVRQGTPSMVLYCLLYTSPSPRDRQKSRMPSSA